MLNQALLAKIGFYVILLLVFIDKLFMFLGHKNLKLCISVIAFMVYLYEITELRKKQLKVEILHNLKKFRKEFFNLFGF